MRERRGKQMAMQPGHRPAIDPTFRRPTAALVTQAVLTLWLFLTFWYPRPSSDPFVLLTQLAQLLGVLVAVTDLLKVWPRTCPLLPGAPTTVHSPLRQAIALTVRLSGPLLQIMSTVLAMNSQHTWAPPQLGFQLLHLSKARAVCMGLLLTNSLPYALPWRTQLWVGPIEVLIISTAMVLASGHWPTVQEAVQLLAYGWVECVVPLFAVRWQQRLGLQPTTPQPSTAADQLPAVEEQQQDLCMPCVDGAPQPALGTGGGGGAGGSTGPGPAGAQVQQEQLPRHQDRPESNLQQQDQHPVAGSPPVPPVPQGTTLSVLDLVQAVQNRGTTLYTSPLQHRAISIKAHRPTCTYSETAAALHQSATTALTELMDSRLAHVSKAWVRGCVHIFVWAAHLKRGSRHPVNPATQVTDLSSPQQPGLNAHDVAPTAIEAALPQHLAAAACEAGAEGLVDVQVDQHTSQRYHLDPATGSASVVGSSSDAGRDPQPLPELIIHHISPPCSALPDPTSGTASTTLELQLSSQQAQRVRVVVVVDVTGAVVVDTEEHVRAGQVSALLLQVPLTSLIAALTTSAGDTSEVLLSSSVCMSQPTALRLVITTPAHQPHSANPPPPARLLTTATLLLAPAPLASELCSLYADVEQEGRVHGLTVGDVWVQHWQPLINDLCLCLSLSHSGASSGVAASAGMQGASTAVDEARTALCRYLTAHNMHGWLHQLHPLCHAATKMDWFPLPAAPDVPDISHPSIVDSAYIDPVDPGCAGGGEGGDSTCNGSRAILLGGGSASIAGSDASTTPTATVSDSEQALGDMVKPSVDTSIMRVEEQLHLRRAHCRSRPASACEANEVDNCGQHPTYLLPIRHGVDDSCHGKDA